ncbi:MAG: AMP-binding protein [Gammaproteobacteria bacterium]
MENANLYHLIRHRLPADPERLAITTPEGVHYRYADLEHESARCANFLTSLGLAPGERVLVQIDKSPEALFLYLGCIRAGFIYLPVNTAYRRAELDYFLSDAEPKVVICSGAALSLFAELCRARKIEHLYTLEGDGSGTLRNGYERAEDRFSTVVSVDRDVAAILYTSGTTGRPKGR